MKIFAAVLALAACTDTPDWREANPTQTKVELKRVWLPQPKELDLLFVVDGAQAMAPSADTVAANAPRFVQVLDVVGGGRPQLHLGVTTTDLGEDGSSASPPAG